MTFLDIRDPARRSRPMREASETPHIAARKHPKLPHLPTKRELVDLDDSGYPSSMGSYLSPAPLDEEGAMSSIARFSLSQYQRMVESGAFDGEFRQRVEIW